MTADAQQISAWVTSAVAEQPVVDMHTHLYPPAFGTPVPSASGQTDSAGLMLWGVDELVTYHYLVAEVYRVVPPSVMPFERFWTMPTRERADHIWRELFIERSPISEACRGVLTTLQKLGLDPNERTLAPFRKFFDAQNPSEFIDCVMRISNVASITMTNNVFDDNERERWRAGVAPDPRFKAVLRIDPLLRDWPAAARKLRAWGYDVAEEITGATAEEVRRFLRDWLVRQQAIYVAVSLPPEWAYPVEDGVPDGGQTILERAVLPVCAEAGLPFAMMIGSTGPVNPGLRDGGHMLGNADVASVTRLCAAFPRNKFFVTLLARENQHALAVAARKFSNLMPFGCWWFLNNPSLIDEITRMRLELLGTAFIPQHSDARVLDQLIYKWDHSRTIIAQALTDKYADAAATGWRVTEEIVRRDVKLLLADNFAEFLAR